MQDAPSQPPLTKEEVTLARDMSELIEVKGWPSYEKLLKAQIELREQMLSTPLSQLNSPEFQGLDFQSKLVTLETIKGAIIGLRLALSLPRSIIDTAKDVTSSQNEEQGS